MLDPLWEFARAYAGWLVTNPEFQRELQDLRKGRDAKFGWCLSEVPPGEGRDSILRRFQQRWQLSGFSSWELPIPQGPNLTGSPWPPDITAGQSMVEIQIPTTIGMRTRFPLREVMETIRRQNTPPHLQDWLKVLSGGKRAVGASRYARIFDIDFYLRVVPGWRYQSKMAGHTQTLDCAVGQFLCIGEEEIKKLRLIAQRRLRSVSL